MVDKTILITGATDGIGEQTALELAGNGASILLHGRNIQKAEKSLDKIIRLTSNDRIKAFIADFSSLNGVKKLADEIKQNNNNLDVLINNAGVYMNQEKITVDGFETTFQVNHLAPFLLTHLLLPLLNNVHSRIINVSSVAHTRGRIDFDNLNGEKFYDAYNAYALSKLANVIFTVELAERLKGTGITVNALHPGVINTKLLRTGFSIMGGSVERGAETSVYLATSSEVEGITGRYFEKKRQSSFNSIAKDEYIRKKFWEISEQMTGIEKYL